MPGRAHRSAHRVTIGAERTAIFSFLAELSNHWLLLGSTVESFEPRLGGAGAVLNMRASPLPIKRRVETEIISTDEPARIRGSAKSRATTATITWTLEDRGGAKTTVTLSVTACPAGVIDKLIVRLGGPWWRSRYRQALKKLAAEFGTEAHPEDCDLPLDLATDELGEAAA